MFAWRGGAALGVVWVLTSQATARDCVVTDDGDLAPDEPTAGTTLRSEFVYTVNVLRAGPQIPKRTGKGVATRVTTQTQSTLRL